MKSPEDNDTRLPADLEKGLDGTANPGLAAVLKKVYSGLREHAPEDGTPDAETDAPDTSVNGKEGGEADTITAGPADAGETAGAGDAGNGKKGEASGEESGEKENKKDDDDEGEEEDDDDDDEASGEEDEDGRSMTLRDHLVELRSRLAKCFLWLLVGFCLSWPWNEELFALLLAPLAAVMPEGVKFVYLSPPEAFFVYMKVCAATGFFLTSPMIFYQVWAFIAPGLYREEKLFILPAALCSALFFLCGVLFCWFVVFDAAFRFFMSYNRGLVQAMLGMDDTLSFALRFLLAFGLVFELPLFIFFLSRLGLVTADMLRSSRRYAVLAAVVIGAILTPPDVISQLLMAGPLILLYEIGIVIAAIFGKKKKSDAAETKDDEEDDGDGDDAGVAEDGKTAVPSGGGAAAE